MKTLTATLVVAFAVSMGASAATAAPTGEHTMCSKTYTTRMADRAIRVTYSGTRTVTHRERKRLWLYLRCQRRPWNKPVVWRYWQTRTHAWKLRLNPPMTGPVTASWYYDAGTTGCGFHASYGIATFVVPCGGHVLLRYGSRTVLATRDDSGPYVGGRVFDLDPATKAALGCSDLCRPVYYH